jgi:hypothetical protein
MNYYGNPIAKLIEEFSKLPGVGGKSAQRMAFHILNMPEENAQALAAAITEAKLANDAVTAVKIKDANVTAAKLAAGAVTETKLALKAVAYARMKITQVSWNLTLGPGQATHQLIDSAIDADILLPILYAVYPLDTGVNAYSYNGSTGISWCLNTDRDNNQNYRRFIYIENKLKSTVSVKIVVWTWEN